MVRSLSYALPHDRSRAPDPAGPADASKSCHQTSRALPVGRQNRRRKPDAFRAVADTVTHARATHRDRTDAGHDLAFGQMSVAHQPLSAVVGELVGMAVEQGRNLGFHRLRKQRSRAVAQNFGQRIGKCPGWESWKTLLLVTAYHSFGGEVGGFEHPHDTPPYPFMPSPTFAHSSMAAVPKYWLELSPCPKKEP